MTARTARARLEALLLAVVALVPAFPHASYLANRTVPRFSMFGDYAVLEQVTRFVSSGRTLVGPYSRFGFNHPGPAYFFVIAPIYWLCGGESRGMFIATFVVNVLSVATIVVAMRLLTSRAHAIAAVLLIDAWLAAFGDVVTNVWNPLAIALPLAAYLVLAALFARGAVAAAVPGASLGIIVAQTHVGADLVVIAVGVIATIAFRAKAAHRGACARRHLRASVGIIVLASIPVLIDQVTSHKGNLTRLAQFFFDPASTRNSMAAAVRDWAIATSWLPNRVLHATLLGETGTPLPMSWERVPGTVPEGVWPTTLVRLAACACALFVALRRRDRWSSTLLLVGIGGEMLSIVALHGIIGDVFPYLLFWVSAVSAVTLLGVLSTACAAIARFRGAPMAALVLLTVGALQTARLQRAWIDHNRGWLPVEDPDLKATYAVLANRLVHDHADPVLHFEGAWTKSTVLALELQKDGFVVYYPERNEFMFGRPPHIAEAKNPEHVYVSDPWHALPQAPCLELVSAQSGTSVFVSPHDLKACP